MERLWTGFGMGGLRWCADADQALAPLAAEHCLTDDRGALGSAAVPPVFIRQLPLAMLFLGVAGASWAPYTPMETTLLRRLVPAEIRGQVFGARHSLVVAAAPLGAAGEKELDRGSGCWPPAGALLVVYA